MLPDPITWIMHTLQPIYIAENIYRFNLPRQYTYIDYIQLCSTPTILAADNHQLTVKVIEPVAVRLVQDEIIVCELVCSPQQIYNLYQTTAVQYTVPIDFFHGYPLITETLRTNISLEFVLPETPTQRFWLEMRLSNVDPQWKMAFASNHVSMTLVTNEICHYVNGAITI